VGLRSDIGRVIDGRIRLLRPLGKGGMGTVYVGVQESLGREVAVKLMTSTRDAAALDRFRREARLLSTLRHPNVVTVHDFGIDDGQPFLVMELVVGETLRTRMARVPAPSTGEVLALLTGVARGLAAAHARGVAHRDLKPENIVVGDDGAVKLLDFGLAKRVDAPDDERVTEPSLDHVLGTPGYIAPEKARQEPVVDERPGDVFAFGVVLFECLAGRLPFDGRSRVELVLALLQGQFLRLRDVLVDVDPSIDTLVDALLAVDARARPEIGFVVDALARGPTPTETLDVPLAEARRRTTSSLTVGGVDRTLRVGLPEVAFPLYPGTYVPSEQTLTLVMERLVERTHDGRLAPAALARFIEEDDGRRVRLWLRDGARFGPHPRHFTSGRAATIDDVVASLTVAIRERPYVGIERVSTDGDCVVAHVSPISSTLHRLADVWLAPAEVLSGEHEDLDDLAHPVGTGRYVVEGRIPGGGVRLVRRDDVSREGAAVVELTRVSDPRRGVALLRDGALDVLWPARADRAALVEGRPPRVRAELLAPGVAAGEFQSGDVTGILMLLPNRRRASPLGDVARRRAIARAIDRTRAAAAVVDKALEPRGRFLPSWLRAADATIEALPAVRDEDARASGPFFLAHVSYVAGAARVVEECLRSAGLDVRREEIDEGNIEHVPFDAFLTVLSVDVFDDGRALLRDLVEFVRGPAWEPPPRVADLVRACEAASTRAARLSATGALERALLDELPLIPLAHGGRGAPLAVVLVGPRVASHVDPTSGAFAPLDRVWRRPTSLS